MKYDLIVIGMGPSAAFLAYELLQLGSKKNILLIDQGKNIKKRFCPIEKTGKCMKCKPFCNITCGFSGAGAFSDGKILSYHMSSMGSSNDMYLGGNNGGYIKEYFSEEEIKDLLVYTDNVYLKFGASTHLEGVEHQDEIKKLQKKAASVGLGLVSCPIRHLGTEKAHVLYTKIQDYLEENGINMMYETEVKDLIIKDNKIKGLIIKHNDANQEENVFGEEVVLAVGRKGASWLSDMCTKYGINTKIGAVDIGVRYELPDKVMKDINKYMYEGKFVGRLEPYKDKVRTFCQNPSGFVSAEVYDNELVLVNGHSYKEKKSTNTNLAILVTHHFTTPFDKPIEFGESVAKNLNSLASGHVMVQRLGDIKRGGRSHESSLANNSVIPTLKDAVAGDLTYSLGYRTMTDILKFIEAIDKVAPGFAADDNLLYGPEIKFYSNEIVLNNRLETNIKGLYSIGDGGGLTTGLMMASASGILLARILHK